ncbi:MAG: hypothetical protein LUI09_05520 [Prevotellaceae bacterium]|nr:hypothetical protein [Prevotellaceae bacterium]
MPIHYSIGHKTIKPGDKSTQRKVYATMQITSVCQTEEFVNRVIKRGFIGDRGHILAVVSAVVDCLREELLEGRRVYVGDLGSFQCVINSTGADTVDDFSAQNNIQGLTVKWMPSKYFENLHREAEYKHVTKRSTQRESMRRSNREMTEKLDAANKKPEAKEE